MSNKQLNNALQRARKARTNPKLVKGKKQIRAELNEIETKKIQRSMKKKKGGVLKDKQKLARLTKKKREDSNK